MVNFAPRQAELARAVLASPDVKIFHFSVLERWLMSGIMLAVFGGFGIDLLVDDDPFGWCAGLSMIGFGVGVSYLMTFRVLVAYTEDHVLVRNVRSRVVLRRDVVAAEPTYEGLVLRTAQGKRLTAAALPRYNLSLFLRRTGRADAVAHDLMRGAHE